MHTSRLCSDSTSGMTFMLFTSLSLGVVTPLSSTYWFELDVKLQFLKARGYDTSGMESTTLSKCVWTLLWVSTGCVLLHQLIVLGTFMPAGCASISS